jgi:hypothetical protein
VDNSASRMWSATRWCRPISGRRCWSAVGRSWLLGAATSAAKNRPPTSSLFALMNTPSDTRRAIAIRQPMAWAVVHAGKDVENRSSSARRQFKPAVGERVLIHASKGMTRVEYERAAEFMAKIGVRCPEPDELARGGVIGSALVIDIVTRHRSRWFRGPHALVLADARPEPFTPVRAQTGLFRVESPCAL